MTKVIELYLNFSKYDKFLESVIKDGRSFDPQLFEKTLKKIDEKNMMHPDDVIEFSKVLETLKVKLKNLQAREDILQNLGNIPTEYIDPVTLM